MQLVYGFLHCLTKLGVIFSLYIFFVQQFSQEKTEVQIVDCGNNGEK